MRDPLPDSRRRSARTHLLHPSLGCCVGLLGSVVRVVPLAVVIGMVDGPRRLVAHRHRRFLGRDERVPFTDRLADQL
jgi:hypothetical protein